jgi:NAD(P)-dependent dehydrogenase (short-subunit alcohol dehydrogenase family)
MVFLPCQDSRYITGQTVHADGGRLGLRYLMPVPDQETG